jgi:hypothetical protein
LAQVIAIPIIITGAQMKPIQHIKKYPRNPSGSPGVGAKAYPSSGLSGL